MNARPKWVAAGGFVSAAGLLLALGLAPTAVLLFVAFAFGAVLLPGLALTPRDLAPGETLATALCSGLALAAAASWAARLAGASDAWTLALLAGPAALGALRGPSERAAAALTLPWAAAVLAATAAVGWTQFGNGLGEGRAFFGVYPNEVWFHSAIAQQLAHRASPELPSGMPIAYHVFYDRQAALLQWASGATIFDVQYRLLPLLYVPTIVTAGAALAARFGAGATAAAFGGAFLLCGDDLSWLAAALGLENAALGRGPSWNLEIGPGLLYALHNNRGLTIGIATFFCALLAADRAILRGGFARTASALLLGFALLEYKSFLHLIFFAATTLVAVVALRHPRGDRAAAGRAAAIAGGLLVMTLPVVLSVSERFAGAPRPLEFVPGYAGMLALLRAGWLPDAEALRRAYLETPVRTLLLSAPLGLGLMALVSTGVRVFGLGALRGRLRGDFDPLAWLLLATWITAAGATACLATPPARENVLYFWAAALALASPLAGARLFAAARSSSGAWRAVACLALLASLPSVLQMLWVDRSFARRPTLVVPAALAASARELAPRARRGEVLLAPSLPSRYIAATVPVTPVAAWDHWLQNAHGREAIRARRRAVIDYYETSSEAEGLALLTEHDVAWIWLPGRGDEGHVQRVRRVDLGTP